MTTETNNLSEAMHAAGASIINAMAEVQLLAISHDHLWAGHGGRPASIEAALNGLDYQKRALAEVFDLAMVSPETPEEETEQPPEPAE